MEHVLVKTVDLQLVGITHLYSAPQPLTKLMRMVHILVSW